MPTVNIYYAKANQEKELNKLIKDLKEYLVDELSCGDIKLTQQEISIRFLHISGGEMIGDVELEITAHAFSERIKRQDEICLNVMRFIMKKLPNIGDVKVWLKLCELGHSWEPVQ